MISPCIRLCLLDPDTRVCSGCGRTLAEIGNWTRYSDAERRAIMDRLPERLGTALPERADMRPAP